MKWLRVPVLTAVLVAAWTAPAPGATYDFFTCHTQDGTKVGTEGWVPLNPNTTSFHYDGSCEDNTFGISTKPEGGPYARGTITGWMLELPRPLSVVGYAAAAPSGSGSVSWAVGMFGRRVGEPNWVSGSVCAGAPSCGESGWFKTIPPLEAFGVAINCYRTDCPSGSSAHVDVEWLLLRVEDPAPPSITATGGPLRAAGVSGVAGVNFQADDEGSGIQSVSLAVDGRVVAEHAPQSWAAPCRPPYTSAQPCARSAASALSVDTRLLTDGVHEFQLTARDAAGNVGTATWNVTTANKTLGNLCTSWVDSRVRTRLRPKKFPFASPGLLTATWPTAPWPAAEAVLLEGNVAITLGPAAPRDAKGRFVLDVAPGVLRRVRVGFRASDSDSGFVCTKPIRVPVLARVKLRATPRSLFNGESVSFSGRLAGGQVAAGRSVVIEARAHEGRRRWVPVRVLRTRPKARFRSRYRFTSTSVETHYEFRARVPRQKGFPFVPSTSAVQRVYVRP
jgi:hypothetical protein